MERTRQRYPNVYSLQRVHEIDIQSRVPKTKALFNYKKKEKLRWRNDKFKWDFRTGITYFLAFNFCFVLGPVIKVSTFSVGSKNINRKTFKRSVNFNTSFMIWWCISDECLEKLCILTGRVDSKVYIEILKHFMLSSPEYLFRMIYLPIRLFSCHMSMCTTTWLRKNKIIIFL